MIYILILINTKLNFLIKKTHIKITATRNNRVRKKNKSASTTKFDYTKTKKYNRRQRKGLMFLQSFWNTPRLRFREASDTCDEPTLGFAGGPAEAELCIALAKRSPTTNYLEKS